jgi:hypothetical protein
MQTVLRTRQGPVTGSVFQLGYGRQCVPSAPSALLTTCGRLVVRHELEPPRFAEVPAVSTFDSGSLRSVVMAQRTLLATPLGAIPAEQVTFYENGSVRRIFPVAGKTGAYWTEEQEGELCPVIALPTPLGLVEARFVSILLHPSGALRSFALWPRLSVELTTPSGRLPCRFGASFYEQGALRSIEPARPVELQTPIGPMMAFDGSAIGIHGDHGSVGFAPDGRVSRLKTESSWVDAELADKTTRRYEPRLVPSMCSDEAMEWQPLTVSFDDEVATLDGERLKLA